MGVSGNKRPGSTQNTSARNRPGGSASSVVCQRCLQKGHWTYACENEPAYRSRPSRTKELLRPNKKVCNLSTWWVSRGTLQTHMLVYVVEKAHVRSRWYSWGIQIAYWAVPLGKREKREGEDGEEATQLSISNCTWLYHLWLVLVHDKSLFWKQ